jgi:hypothetical protein
MKTKWLLSKTLALLAITALMNISVTTQATGVFPLDLWEEMADWRQSRSSESKRITEATRPSGPKDVEGIEMVPTAFPLDVWKALDDIGDTDGFAKEPISKGYPAPADRRTVKQEKPNPFWLPEEIRAP